MKLAVFLFSHEQEHVMNRGRWVKEEGGGGGGGRWGEGMGCREKTVV